MLSTPLAVDFGPGLEVGSDSCAAGRVIIPVIRLIMPLVTLAYLAVWQAFAANLGHVLEEAVEGPFSEREGRGSVSYASCRRLRAWPGGGVGGAHSWTGNLIPTPLSADFGPGQERTVEGRAAGRGVCFLRSRLREA